MWTYRPVTNSTLAGCGLIQVLLGQHATISIAARHGEPLAKTRASGHVTAQASVHRKNPRNFEVTFQRSDVAAYRQHDLWWAYSVGGGACQLAAIYDFAPDKGSVKP